MSGDLNDTQVWDRIRFTVSELGRAHVRAGVVGEAAQQMHGDSGETNGEIALWMEYGTRNLPARSFLRKTLREPAFRSALLALEARLAGQVIAGSINRDEALKQIGDWVSEQMRQTIIDDKVTPELAPSTVAAKGHAKVLVDSRRLVDAIGSEIVK